MDLNKNYYKVLNVDKNSDDKDIKKSYRKLAIENHPDKNNGDDKKFKEINEAYLTLSDKTTKQNYDNQSPHGKNYNPMNNIHNGFNFNFGGTNPFDFIFNFNTRNEFIEYLDITVNKEITLKDIYNDNDINIKYDRFISCDECNGTGFDPNSESYECDVCNGSGKVWEPGIGYRECEYCVGKGKIHAGTCKKCNGDKIIKKTEEFKLNNIFRIQGDDTKYIKGYGHQSKYYRNKKGNLILNLKYNHDIRYDFENFNLIYNLDLHYQDAINGVEYEYTHLDGKIYNVKIPPKTKDNDKLKLPKLGLLYSPKDRKDLYLIINIIIDYEKI